jgi:hypothetical protein
MVGTAAGRMARVALIVSSVLLAATAYAANTINGRVLVAGAPVAKSEVTVTIVSQFRDQARLAYMVSFSRSKKEFQVRSVRGNLRAHSFMQAASIWRML